MPFQRSLPLPGATFEVFNHLLFTASFLVFGWVRFDLRPSALVIALIALALAFVVAGAVLTGGLNPNRRLYVSEAAVRVDRIFGSVEVPWWKLQSVSATGDIATVVLVADHRQVRIDLRRLDETERRAFVNALRARLAPGVAIQVLQESRLSRRTAANSFAALGYVALLSTVFLEPHAGALGVRCSGPSAYLSARFDVPRQPGCVFIRVSGAASRAGIRRGDQMIALDGVAVTSGPQFSGLFDAHHGNTFVFTVVRSHTHEIEDVKVSFGRGSHIEAPSDDPITHFLKAKDDLGHHPEIGIREYSQAIALAPDFELAYVGRAQEEESSHDRDAAILDYRRAIELDPDLPEALRSLASLLGVSNDPPPQEAADLVVHAIGSDHCNAQTKENNTDCAHDYGIYADIVLRLRDPHGAIGQAEEALRFNPDEWPVHATLAWAYGQLGDHDRARSELALYRSNQDADDVTVRGLETAIAFATQGTMTP